MKTEKFDIHWYDLNRIGQKRLLGAIFGSEPLVSIDIEDEIEVETVCYADDLDISDKKED